MKNKRRLRRKLLRRNQQRRRLHWRSRTPRRHVLRSHRREVRELISTATARTVVRISLSLSASRLSTRRRVSTISQSDAFHVVVPRRMEPVVVVVVEVDVEVLVEDEVEALEEVDASTAARKVTVPSNALRPRVLVVAVVVVVVHQEVDVVEVAVAASAISTSNRVHANLVIHADSHIKPMS
jgi:hypothetical protein